MTVTQENRINLDNIEILTDTTPIVVEERISTKQIPILNQIVSAVEHEMISKQTLIDKSPLLEEIVTMSLTVTRDFLKDLANPDVRRVKVNTVQDARCLSSISKELNEMLRLELGKHTSLVKHDVQLSIERTKEVFKELRELDPVFDYPEEEDGQEVKS